MAIHFSYYTLHLNFMVILLCRWKQQIVAHYKHDVKYGRSEIISGSHVVHYCTRKIIWLWKTHLWTLLSCWGILILFHCDGYRKCLTGSYWKGAEVYSVGFVKIYICQLIMMNKSDTISTIFMYQASIEICKVWWAVQIYAISWKELV